MFRPSLVTASLLVLTSFGVAQLNAQQTFVLNDYNNRSAGVLTEGFQEELGQFATRLYNNTSGFGEASSTFGAPVDLSGFLEGTLNVRFNPLAGHNTDYMTLELLDNQSNSLQYRVDTTRPTQPGGFGFYEDFLPVNNPVGGAASLANFDLANVSQWNVLGQVGSAGPFNVSLFNIELEGPELPVQYGGLDPNATWRQQAATMIDQNRKSNLTLRVQDQAGHLIDGAQVHVKQTRQAFQFGTAVSVDRVLGTNATDLMYQEKLLELFNSVTIENGLKWDPLAGDWGPNWNLARSVQAVDWLNQHGLETRGHVLIWPGSQNMPSYLDPLIAAAQGGNLQAQQDLRQEILDHIAEVAGATNGKVVDWDVVNEIGTNNDVLNIYGESIMDEWFAASAAANPGADRFINEFNIISDQERAKRQRYLNSIQGLVNRGAQIDAIGMQAHFSDTSLTDIDKNLGSDPQDVWDILDMFHDATGLPIKITEYDLNTTNETNKANYLRDFLTAVFAHEAVDGFIMWGFWEGRHWRPDAAMINQDWTETPMAQVWRDLVLDEWMTDEMLTALGADLDLRAFRGDYQIEVTYLGESYIFDLTLGDSNGTFDLTLPVSVASADFDMDGDVDGQDFLKWQRGESPDPYSQTDLLLWQSQFGSQIPASVAVPEPHTTLALLVLSVTVLCGVRSWRL